MPKIPLTNGFQIVSEGTHIFFIYKVEYDEEFGKMKIHLVNAKGVTHIERFFLKRDDGEYNDKALNAFSFFAHQALDSNADEAEPEELVGHYICADVVHNKVPSNTDPSKVMTFANLGDKSPASGFSEPASDRAMKIINETKKRISMSSPVPTDEATGSTDLDLDALLGE